MATHDYVIANGTGAAVRSDINDALAAIVSNNSSSSEPATTYAYQWWADTNANVLKIRNSANNAWITLRELDGTMLIEDGSASTPGLAFADDVNTGIFSPAADQIGFATGGAERLEIGSSEVVFNDPSNDVDFRVESDGNTHMLFVEAGVDRVGIGASSPNGSLSVQADSGRLLTFRNSTTGTGASDGSYITLNGSDLQISNAESANTIFYTGDTERMRIDSSGRLLINTTNGVELIYGVGGGLKLTRNKTGNPTSGQSLMSVGFHGVDDTNSNGAAEAKIEAFAAENHSGTTAASDLRFYTKASGTGPGSSPTERMRINSSGDVQARRARSNTAGDVALSVQPSDSTIHYGLRIDAANNSLNLDRASGTATNLLTFDSSGNIGIGNSTPGRKVHIHDGSGSSAQTLLIDSGGVGLLSIQSGTTSESRIEFGDSSNDDAGYIYYENNNDVMRFGVNASERARIDSSGRLLYGHTTSRSVYGIQSPVQIEGTNFETGTLSVICNNVSDFPVVLLARSRGSSLGSHTAPTDGQILGEVSFVPSDGTNYGAASVRIQGVADDNHAENDVPGRFVIQTVPSGSESSVERLRIHHGGKLTVPGVYNSTTTGGSAVYVESDGDLLRFTSSLKYKTDVETIEDARADAILNCRPVWYRSKCENDIKTEGSEKSDWGWYGFIAEEVAEIEPRLVNWATKSGVQQEDGSVESVERDPADYEAEGVRYDNFVPLLVNLVKRQQAAIETLEAKVAALEAG